MTQHQRKVTVINTAFEIRHKMGLSLLDFCNPYEIARREGLDVRFASLMGGGEGVFENEKKCIIINSNRSYGRQAFTCAHELGHYYLGHKTSTDSATLLKKNETEAQIFASFLLMPKTTVVNCFKKRELVFEEVSEVEVFKVSNWLGVGYSTLLEHIRINLKLIPLKNIKRLLSRSPKLIRRDFSINENIHMIIIDSAWGSRPIFLKEGDVILITVPLEGDLGPNVWDETCLHYEESPIKDNKGNSYLKFTALKRGHAKLELNNGMSYNVQIAPHGYEGRYIFMYYAD